jgi:CheY-like chemotaxis protein
VTPRAPVVAVLNNNPDLINMIATWLETHGIRAVCGSLRDFRRGHHDIVAFINRHIPTVVLFDLSMPYPANWDYLEVLRMMPETQGIPFVITTGNKVALETAVGPTNAIEITGTVQSFTEVTNAIHAAHQA